MNQTSSAWLRSLRADSIAKVILTRNPDVVVSSFESETANSSLDLLVTIDDGLGIENPKFGVENKAKQGANSAYARHLAFQKQKTVPRNLPVCLFLIDINAEQGSYAWILKPEVGADGKARLIPFEETDARVPNGHPTILQALDESGLTQLLEEVRSWFRALRASQGSHHVFRPTGD